MSAVSPSLPFDLVKGKIDLPLREKLALFGDSAIPLIFPLKSKGEAVPGSFFNQFDHLRLGWSKRTKADTLTPEYQADLWSQFPHNVGIRQGGGLTDIVAFDVDTDDETVISELLEANPFLKNTFTTRGRRGCTFWFKIKGDYLAHKKAIRLGEGVEVEWRGNLHSLIHGEHPKSTPEKPIFYGVLNQVALVEVAWKELCCPPVFRWYKDWPQLHEASVRTNRVTGGPNLTPAQRDARVEQIESRYEIFSWPVPGVKAHARCKNEAAHTNPTREEDCVIFTGADERGTISYHCSHTHCENFNQEETAALVEILLKNEDTFILPNTQEKLTVFLAQLFGRLTELGYYRRSEEPPYALRYYQPGCPQVREITKGNLANVLGAEKINFVKYNAKGNLAPVTAQKELATAILEAHQAEILSVAAQIAKNPLLVKTPEGAALVGEKYCAPLKSIILGKESDLPEMDFSQGRKLIAEFQDYWIWKEPVDRARGLAALLSPALFQGGFITRPIPAFLLMADNLHAGKTAWQQNLSVIYDRTGVEANNYKDISIRTLEEKFQLARYQGDRFFFIDELDGAIKSTTINAYITGADEGMARTLYRAYVKVPERMIVLLAGVTGFTIEEQLASRALPIRILKPIAVTNWYTPSGVALQNWVIDHSRELLAGIYAIIKEWVRRGARCDEKISWRFPEWEKHLNGILSFLGLPRVTAGLEKLQNEISNPAGTWLPYFTRLLVEQELVYSGTEEKEVAKLLNLEVLRELCDSGGLEIPGVNSFLREPALGHRKKRRISEIITSLSRISQTNGAEPIYQLGEYYLAQYQQHNGHKRTKSYLFSSTLNLPKQDQIVKYQLDPEDMNQWNS